MNEWLQYLEAKEKEFGKHTVNKWLRTLQVIKFDACNLYLQAQDSFQASWFEEHIRSDAIKKFINANHARIAIHLSIKNLGGTPTAATSEPTCRFVFDTFDPTHVFETFLSSPENETSLRIYRKLLSDYKEGITIDNPLCLYGPPGCGKSHLLMSTAAYLKQHQLRPAYVRADTFTSHVVTAFRLGAIKEFRKIYRHVDALIIDDVHRLSRRVSTGEELFHTFNELHAKGKLIILACRCPPKELEEIEERLTSRFEWGIVLNIHALAQSNLIDLAMKRCQSLNICLQKETLQYLVDKFTDSAAIINAINALVLRSNQQIASINSLQVKEVELILRDLLEKKKSKELTPIQMVKEIALFYGISSQDLLGKSQSHECTLPRKIAMYFCRDILQISYPKIGRIFSRDHSTVMTSVKQIADVVNKRDSIVSQEIRDIEKKLKTLNHFSE